MRAPECVVYPSLFKLGTFVYGWARGNYPWTNVYGVGRTLLAAGTALTLTANRSEIFFRPAAGIPDYPCCQGITKLSIFCLGSGHLEIVRWVAVICLLIVATGWRPRYTAIPHWWISFSLQTTAITLDGGDQLTAVLTFLLLPIALTDKRRWHWQTAPRCQPSIGAIEALRRTTALAACVAIRIQVAMMYFHAAVGKLSVQEWVDGTVLYYWFSDPIFGLPDWLRAMTPLLTSSLVAFATWSVLLLEILLFMALIMPKRLWRYCLIAGIVFHFAIGVTMGLISFGIASCAALVFYLRPSEQPFGFWFEKNLIRRKQRQTAHLAGKTVGDVY